MATELSPLLFLTSQQPEVNIFLVINVLNQFTEVSYDIFIYKPQHEISNNVVYATSKAWDKPAPTIWSF